jgi:hypothetical protein
VSLKSLLGSMLSHDSLTMKAHSVADTDVYTITTVQMPVTTWLYYHLLCNWQLTKLLGYQQVVMSCFSLGI